MGEDPLYRDERRLERMAADPQIVERVRLVWPRLVTGLVALALIGAIWLTWRFG